MWCAWVVLVNGGEDKLLIHVVSSVLPTADLMYKRFFSISHQNNYVFWTRSFLEISFSSLKQAKCLTLNSLLRSYRTSIWEEHEEIFALSILLNFHSLICVSWRPQIEQFIIFTFYLSAFHQAMNFHKIHNNTFVYIKIVRILKFYVWETNRWGKYKRVNRPVNFD